MVADLAEQPLDFSNAGQVGAQRHSLPAKLLDFCNRLSRFHFRRTVMDYNARPLASETHRDSAPQPFRRSGNQSDAICECAVHAAKTLAQK